MQEFEKLNRAEQELIHDLHALRPEEAAVMVLLQSRLPK
ncbi:hypothetical protein GJA_2606 [Janthinobacterium agaricidamnosum NBRC 102515 = DSM 9628]|uniref:Uncharacterized protein n=1 Tax=Janthinobacterium agaricidamnosum NBRC 102515 = DSM 9628 TaxID=1349767 RepID=W0V7J0_9BURK|nr:hypothetical protein GJA_2606 [Janthinobacterium agaricidamnosum NBRC 102515 = DSM 9628]